MSRVKCIKCGKLAHLVIEGKAYCDKCAPKQTMPVSVEETLVNELVIEKIDPEPLGYSKSRMVQRKPWWKRLFSL